MKKIIILLALLTLPIGLFAKGFYIRTGSYKNAEITNHSTGRAFVTMGDGGVVTEIVPVSEKTAKVTFAEAGKQTVILYFTIGDSILYKQLDSRAKTENLCKVTEIGYNFVTLTLQE